MKFVKRVTITVLMIVFLTLIVFSQDKYLFIPALLILLVADGGRKEEEEFLDKHFR